ncbi:hypothetical protein Halru_2312 [Halovivax ruber XH-70]|uniref:Uncharacterized protein n=1 Tax=Halovivax ruber (strain DSM 18193 / JCM 13892 / XH-70) TaxID=797302 RepID=L0IG08_HALRX|nr:hypothetical protein Halru_2312 [Halovivax ruber XH-70]
MADSSDTHNGHESTVCLESTDAWPVRLSRAADCQSGRLLLTCQLVTALQPRLPPCTNRPQSAGNNSLLER